MFPWFVYSAFVQNFIFSLLLLNAVDVRVHDAACNAYPRIYTLTWRSVALMSKILSPYRVLCLPRTIKLTRCGLRLLWKENLRSSADRRPNSLTSSRTKRPKRWAWINLFDISYSLYLASGQKNYISSIFRILMFLKSFFNAKSYVILTEH